MTNQELGKIPDFNRLETEHLLSLPFENISEYPDLVFVARTATAELNKKREQYDLPDLDTSDTNVRLIPADIFNSDEYCSQQGENAGFYDRRIGKAVLPFDREEYRKNVVEVRSTWYKIVHELAHGAMGGLTKDYETEELDFFSLDEGIVDMLARDILNQKILPARIGRQVNEQQRQYVDNVHPQLEGFLLTPEDIIPTQQGLSQISYSRIPQIRLVELIRSINPPLYEALLAKAFHGDRKEASELLLKGFGAGIHRMLLDRNSATVDVIKAIRESKN